MTRKSILSSLPLTLSVALFGCDPKEEEVDPPVVGDEVGLRRMEGCDDLRAQLSDAVLDQLSWGYYGRGFYPGEDVALDNGAPEADGDAAGGGGDAPTDFSNTNTQEAGVDEIDLVKTNGTHMFIAQDRALHIAKAWPAADSAKLATIELDGWASGLFLTSDDRVVVVETLDGGLIPGEDAWRPMMRARVVNVADPAAPVVEQVIDLEGWLADARMIDDEIFLVLNQYVQLPSSAWEAIAAAGQNLQYPAWDAPESEWEAARETLRNTLRPVVEAQIAALDLDKVLPQTRTGEGAFSSMYDCADLYVPAQDTPLAMLSVSRLDPETGAVHATGLMSDGWTVYASTENLYVAQSSRWWWGWDATELESHIHKFGLSGGAEPAYLGSGSVGGWIYDQFAMSEFNGDLRVVTTDGGGWWGGGVAVDVAVSDDVDAAPAEDGDVAVGSEGSEGSGEAQEVPAEEPDEPVTDIDEEPPVDPNAPANNVYVLRPTATGDLEVIGHVGDIAPGETIQSARLMGERGYIVTFRQTDPLFTLDLSDPTAPAVVGELVMPGYSAYLHPLGENHLIGVGMAGLETGQLTGLAINLFDVSNPANPTLVAQHAIDPGDNAWSWSEAMWDHHAFTYHRDVLTIPAYTSSWDENTGEWSGFSGTISFRVTVDGGIEELGRTDHSALVEESECLYDRWWGGEFKEETDVVVDDGGDRDEVAEPAPMPAVEEGVTDGSDGDQAIDPDGGGGAGEPGEEPVEPSEPFSYCDDGYYWGYAQVRRSVVIEDYLYTISNFGVKVTDLEAPDQEISHFVFYPAPAAN